MLFKLIKEEVPKKIEGSILELGSGFFPLSYQAANLFKENEVIAYETSLVPYLFSKIYLFAFPLKNLKIIRKDFFKVSFHEGKLLLCYLYPAAMQKLENKFEKELPKEAYIISNTFALPNKKPEKVITTDDLYKTKIYLYKNS
ncbi:MAG TPA: SAM-dependent methyltransferase [Parachlamydiaceae bacterium]|nr:SAM-dependent methyltransferase [Parachlamydiaceae bacterium]